jgi:hypothetical protein
MYNKLFLARAGGTSWESESHLITRGARITSILRSRHVKRNEDGGAFVSPTYKRTEGRSPGLSVYYKVTPKGGNKQKSLPGLQKSRVVVLGAWWCAPPPHLEQLSLSGTATNPL